MLGAAGSDGTGAAGAGAGGSARSGNAAAGGSSFLLHPAKVSIKAKSVVPERKTILFPILNSPAQHPDRKTDPSAHSQTMFVLSCFIVHPHSGPNLGVYESTVRRVQLYFR